MYDKQSLLKCFQRPDDKLLFAKVIDQACFCVSRQCPAFTSFIDPARLEVMLAVLSKHTDIKNVSFGGYPNAERKMIGFAPNNHSLTDKDFPICSIKINFGNVHKTLTHRDFLGSVVGLGIDRAKIGDIIIQSTYAVVFVCGDIGGFILSSLTKISSVGITTEPNTESDFIDEAQRLGSLMRITVSSLRLDTLIAAVFKLSRNEAAELINTKRAFINWSVCGSSSRIVEPGETVTLRGYGRVRLNSICGETKKGKLQAEISLFF